MDADNGGRVIRESYFAGSYIRTTVQEMICMVSEVR